MEMENVIEIEVEAQESAPQGLSAYEVYLNNGGTLSEEEWLASLKGEKGDTGEQGEKGDKGDTGEKGDKGDKGEQGEVGPQGPQGEQGIQGPQGEQGPQGIQGEKGETGATGPAGADGEDGVSLEEVKTITGELESLATEDKSNLVNAINEVLNSCSGGESTPVITELTGPFYGNNRDTGLYKIPANKLIQVNCHSSTTAFTSFTPTGVTLAIWNKESNIGLFLYNGVVKVIGHYGSGSTQIKTNITLSLSGVITASDAQTIKSVKTFTKLPETSVTPTTDVQFVNKKYVDDAIASLKAELGA